MYIYIYIYTIHIYIYRDIQAVDPDRAPPAKYKKRDQRLLLEPLYYAITYYTIL